MTEKNHQKEIGSSSKGCFSIKNHQKEIGSFSNGWFAILENKGNYPENDDEIKSEKSNNDEREVEKSNNDESEVKKSRKRMRKDEEKVNKGLDPLVLLGSDIMNFILNRLDAASLGRCLLVSQPWQELASTDRLWAPLCQELWRGKGHIPRIARLPGLPKLSVYSLSANDGNRKRITKEDLWDHVWEFRCNKDAPDYWREFDPSWNGNGRPPIRRYFSPDGSQTADPGDLIWGGHEAAYTTVTSLNADGTVRANYVRINSYPQLSITRKSDWTWEMSNEMVRYNSIPDSDKEEGTGPMGIGFSFRYFFRRARGLLFTDSVSYTDAPSYFF